jgi:ubiquitin-small subunit ribosomal protein S27Ae
MQIFVGSTAYEVDASTSVETLMNQIENKEFVPSGSFCLRTANGTILELGSLLEVEEDDELTMSLVVPGGMRNKWKKKRMRRLRRKRRKMRQRAR